jgi:hypothetical protein
MEIRPPATFAGNPDLKQDHADRNRQAQQAAEQRLAISIRVLEGISSIEAASVKTKAIENAMAAAGE